MGGIIVLAATAGLVVGGAVVWAVLSSKVVKARTELEGAMAQVEREKELSEKALAEARKETERAKKEEADAVAVARREGAEAVATAKKEAAEAMEKQLKVLDDHVRAATENMIKLRSGELQKANTEQMDSILKPIKENITKIESELAKTRETSAVNKTAIETAIRGMIEQTVKVGKSADELSSALLKKNKIAGNWGENVLVELLESQGFVEGIAFETQQTLRDESGAALRNEDSGKKMIPDVILHLDGNRDLVIDSKVSLAAFMEWCSSVDDEVRAEAFKKLKESVKSHIDDLSGKNYSEYIKGGKNVADFVVMFMPIDGAALLVYRDAPELWDYAFKRHVYIASAQSLIPALKLIEMSWSRIEQDKNTQKILDEARKLVDRIGQFYTEFEEVGKSLSRAQEKYKSVQDKVKDGNQSILGAGQRLVSYGVKGKKDLPAIGE